MKKIILFLQLVVASLICQAQTPNWIWGESETSGSCNMDTHGIWVGPSGNVYIGGRFGGTLTLNGASGTASGTEIFSAKMDSAGHFRWIAPHPYTNENDYDYGFGADKRENTYVTGQTQGANGLYIDKYDSAGTKIWSFAPASLSSGMGGYGNISIDNQNNVYATGSFGQSENFGPVTLNPVGTNDIFLVRLDSNGNCKWAIQSGGSGANDGGRGVVVAPDGGLYVCGSYNGTTTFNGTTSTTITLPNVSSDCFFIAKYDTTGNLLWVQHASNAGFQSGAFYWQFNAITVDSCSNVYVTGHFVNTAQFGPFTLNNKGNYDVFVAKCMANGTWEWAQSAGGAGNDEGFGIVLDKYSDVYVTGYFSGTANFGTQTLTTSAANIVFVAKYSNSNGALQWVAQGGGSLGNDGIGISLDKQGYAYIVGDLAGGSGAIFGSSTVNGIGGCNIFLAKLDTAPHRTITPVVSANYCPGETTTLPYTITGIFNSGNTFTTELSNDSGSFVSPKFLGDTISNSNGTITITIPANITPGSNYLIRVVSDSPATSSWANGCGAYYMNNVYINDFYVSIGNSLASSIVPDPAAVCSGGSVLLTASGGGGLTYQWSNGANTDTTTVSPTKDTSYIVTISNGTCSGSDTVHVTVNTAPPLSIQPSAPIICQGTNTTLKVDTSGKNYTWTPSASLSVTTGDSVIASPIVTTTYTVTGIDSLGCNVSDSVVVSVSNNVTLTILPQPPPTFCSGLSVELMVSGGGTNFTWSPSSSLSSSTGDSVNAFPIVSTTYTVTGNDSLGCAAAGTEIVNVIASPNKPTFYQHGDTLTSSSKFDNQWYMNGNLLNNDTSQNLIITNTSPDQYWVVVANEANGCSTSSDTSITTGIQQLASISNQLSIYPNPFNSIIFIQINSSAQNVKDWKLLIADVLGRTVYSQSSLNYTNDIDLSNLSGGVYFITIINKNGRAVFPIVRQN